MIGLDEKFWPMVLPEKVSLHTKLNLKKHSIVKPIAYFYFYFFFQPLTNRKAEAKTYR